MNNPGEQDDLWQLLGKAKKPAASPFFARNVLREIRSTRPAKAGFRVWLRNQWRPIALSSAAAVLLAMNAAHFFPAHKTAVIPPVTNPGRADFEINKNLDALLAYEEHSIWLDDTTQ